MTEITITLPDPAQTVELLHNAARHAGGTGWDHKSAQHTDWLARQITAAVEEQVKPAIEEPTENFSVIEVDHPTGVTRMRLTLLAGTWSDVYGNGWGNFTEFKNPEVLRIGVGEREFAEEEIDQQTAEAQAKLQQWEAVSPLTETEWKNWYSKGYDEGLKTATNVHVDRLKRLRVEAITSERQDAYDKAIQAVQELQS